ncbi:unnamed protein product [Effrenium voratum]|nr:unnamed protein product [Effrenium voratum]
MMSWGCCWSSAVCERNSCKSASPTFKSAENQRRLKCAGPRAFAKVCCLPSCEEHMGGKKAFVPEARAANSCRFCLLLFGSAIELLGFWWLGVRERNSFKVTARPNSLNSAGSKLSLGNSRAGVLAVQQVLPAMAQWGIEMPPDMHWIGGGHVSWRH